MSEGNHPLESPLGEDFFPDPTTFPGASTRMLCPDQLWEWAEPCGPVASVPKHFGLTEDPVTSIQKSGIRLCGHDFTSPDLMPWTTGGDEVPDNLYVRYDRALATRGALREVELILEHPDGVREVVAVCRRDQEVADRSSVAEFRYLFGRLVRDLSDELDRKERAYRELEAHERSLAQFYHPHPDAEEGAARVDTHQDLGTGGTSGHGGRDEGLEESPLVTQSGRVRDGSRSSPWAGPEGPSEASRHEQAAQMLATETDRMEE